MNSPAAKSQNLYTLPKNLPVHLYAAYEHTDAAAELWTLAFSGSAYMTEAAENSEGTVSVQDLRELRDWLLAGYSRAGDADVVVCGRSEIRPNAWHAWRWDSEGNSNAEDALTYVGQAETRDAATRFIGRGRDGQITRGIGGEVFNVG